MLLTEEVEEFAMLQLHYYIIITKLLHFLKI